MGVLDRQTDTQKERRSGPRRALLFLWSMSGRLDLGCEQHCPPPFSCTPKPSLQWTGCKEPQQPSRLTEKEGVCCCAA